MERIQLELSRLEETLPFRVLHEIQTSQVKIFIFNQSEGKEQTAGSESHSCSFNGFVEVVHPKKSMKDDHYIKFFNLLEIFLQVTLLESQFIGCVLFRQL